MYDRIFKNWRTSLFGLICMISSFVLVYLEKASLTELSSFIAIGLGAIFMKDTKDANNLNLILVLCIIIPSCKVSQKVNESIKETVYYDTIIERIPSIVEFNIPADTIIKVEKEIVYKDKIIRDIINSEFSIDSLYAENQTSFAWAGVQHNIPFLNLYQKDTVLKLTEYYDKIKILEKRLIESKKETVIVKKTIFYKNIFFWLFSLLSLCCLLFGFVYFHSRSIL
ncbi:MAG: hypothetical protein N4A49_06705 [Marinifilaceae bacterium]|jgi:hypothetical protein|nr:hypothetical protein [Marinifilaceae bacterium]